MLAGAFVSTFLFYKVGLVSYSFLCFLRKSNHESPRFSSSLKGWDSRLEVFKLYNELTKNLTKALWRYSPTFFRVEKKFQVFYHMNISISEG